MLQSNSDPSRDFTVTETIEFTVPTDMRSTKVNNEGGIWIRVRLMSGGYGLNQSVTLPTTPATQIDYVQPQPPAVGVFCFGYSWVRGPEPLESVLTYNDFVFTDQTDNAHWPGNKFAIFQPTDEVPPTLYLGFSSILPVNNFGMMLLNPRYNVGGTTSVGWK